MWVGYTYGKLEVRSVSTGLGFAGPWTVIILTRVPDVLPPSSPDRFLSYLQSLVPTLGLSRMERAPAQMATTMKEG